MYRSFPVFRPLLKFLTCGMVSDTNQ